MARSTKKPTAVWTDYLGRKINVVLVNYLSPKCPYGFPQAAGYQVKVVKTQEPYRKGFSLGAVSPSALEIGDATDTWLGTWRPTE